MTRSVRRVLGMVVAVSLVACGSGPRLHVSPEQAEFPLGDAVRIDGGIGAQEWAEARRLEVHLVDGRDVEILVQRDRRSFYFAFVGLDGLATREIHPEIMIDTWGNGSTRLDDHDWWFSIGRRACSQRGGFGDGECGTVFNRWETTLLPVREGQAVEVAIQFAAVGFRESYDGTIGLGFRFVDEAGEVVGAWPPRAEVDRPSTWARISLAH